MYFIQLFSQKIEKNFFDDTFLLQDSLIKAPKTKNLFLSASKITLQSQHLIFVVRIQLINGRIIRFTNSFIS